MKKIASKELKAFLQDWLNWAEGRSVRHTYFSVTNGICCASLVIDRQLSRELSRLFNYDPYPFGRENYTERMSRGTQHQDPNRLAWVRAALNDTLDTWALME